MHKASYEVRFFRHLVNGSGKPYRSRLTTLNIRRCGNPRQAAKVAIKEFEHQWALYEWKNLADEIEVAEVTPTDTSVPHRVWTMAYIERPIFPLPAGLRLKFPKPEKQRPIAKT